MSKTTNINLHDKEFHNCHHAPDVNTFMYLKITTTDSRFGQ